MNDYIVLLTVNKSFSLKKPQSRWIRLAVLLIMNLVKSSKFLALSVASCAGVGRNLRTVIENSESYYKQVKWIYCIDVYTTKTWHRY